jgi:CDP-paratose 2-epimerase
LKELDTRWDYADPNYEHGIAETFSIDRTLHSLFGASKVAADVIAQEYGRYFGMKTGIFRIGCVTGPSQSGVELHGFLSYLVLVSLREGPYTIFGYKGKQVRDQIHSRDVIAACWRFARAPRPGEVYNLGGGRSNAASVVECIEMIAGKSGKRPQVTYSEQHRTGDHICYYSDLRKFKEHFPGWALTHSLEDIVEELVESVPRRERW